MKKIVKITSLFLVLVFVGCSIFESDDCIDQSNIDFLAGVEESGKIKRELHYGSSDDETLNSDIVFEYENDRLIKKTYNDFFANSSYVSKQDIFTYQDGKLVEMSNYFRSTQSSSLNISNKNYYYHPDVNTRVETRYYKTGELKDSAIFIYENDLLINEKHLSASMGEWEIQYIYNYSGKLLEQLALPARHLQKNYFEENGLLYKSESIVEGEVKATSYYESELRSGQLIIKEFSENPYSNYERLLVHRKDSKTENLLNT